MSNSIPLPQTMGHTTMQMQKQKVELAQNEVKALGQSNLSQAEKTKKLREQCEGFESIFIQKMWQQMRATLPQENPLVGREEKFWQSMYDTELSKKMAEGGGIGLADMMYEQLSQNLVSASRTTAAQSANSGGLPLVKSIALDKNTQPAERAFKPEPFMPSPLAGLTSNQPKANNDSHDLLGNLNKDNNILNEQNGNSANTSKQQDSNAALYEDVKAADLYAPVGPYATTPASVAGSNSVPGVSPSATVADYMKPRVTQHNDVAQQYTQSLQAKQQNNAQYLGLQNAAQAKFTVGSPPPAHGVLPKVIRTTYTTNVPKNLRTTDTQKLVQEALLRSAQAIENKQQQQHMAGQQQVNAQQHPYAQHPVQNNVQPLTQAYAQQPIPQQKQQATQQPEVTSIYAVAPQPQTGISQPPLQGGGSNSNQNLTSNKGNNPPERVMAPASGNKQFNATMPGYETATVLTPTPGQVIAPVMPISSRHKGDG